MSADSPIIKKELREYVDILGYSESELLKKNRIVSMISDAGTPSISDPGFLLVRECIKNDILVETLPGPTALIPALVNSGLASDRFVFEGFLPHKKGRLKRLLKLQAEQRTIVMYESPHRLIKTLSSLIEIFGSCRKVSVSRELTKIYEETKRGTVKEVLDYFSQAKIKGEFVIAVSYTHLTLPTILLV